MDDLDWIRNAKKEQMKEALQRYQDTLKKRQRIKRDTDYQLKARALRLIQTGATSEEVIDEVLVTDLADPADVNERIIGETKDFQFANFLPRGARVSNTVARISLSAGQQPLGTGFLVSPRLLMTNNHVLPDESAASRVTAQFGAELDVDHVAHTPTEFQLDPDGFFVTDKRLDFSLVLVRPGADGRHPGQWFGWNRLIASQGKLVIGEAVNVIGHPKGRLKEITIRRNYLVYQLPEFLQYETDTEPGNSGSPVFNDQWEVVALHHSGVPKTDARGNPVRRNGSVEWIANEGIRVSAILKHLSELTLDPSDQAILTELGPQARFEGTPEAQGDEAWETLRQQRRGLTGRRTPLRDGVQVLFIHGRGQHGRDPEELRRTWTTGLNNGLAAVNLPMVDPKDVWFPFYGDRLDALLSPEKIEERLGEGLDPAEALAPSDDRSRRIYEELINEAAVKAGMPTESVHGLYGRLRDSFGWLAGHTSLDDKLIAGLFSDVAMYLGQDNVRSAVLDCVTETLPRETDDLIIVSHSLGTVVAMDLLHKIGARAKRVWLATVGSPLGMDAVYSRLLLSRGRDEEDDPKCPRSVKSWLNVWCPNDPVTTGCPLTPRWQGLNSEIDVDNIPASEAHSIALYLAHPQVAKVIGEAMQLKAEEADSVATEESLDTPVPGLKISIRTGGDDLRANSEAIGAVDVLVGDLVQPFSCSLNDGGGWDDWTTHSVFFKLPDGVTRGDLRTFYIRFVPGSGGFGSTGDNWNMQNLVVSYPAGGTDNTLIAQSGDPLKRFTGRVREWKQDF